jgi:AraC family transcriptional regulator, transcriptional activator of pobA
MLQKNITRLSLEEVFANNVERPGSEYYIFEHVDQHEYAGIYKPYRFNYFTILLVKTGAINIRLNLSAYCVKANHLLLIGPSSVNKVEQISEDCQFLGISFTQQSLGLAGWHHKHIEVFQFLSSQRTPHFSLTPDEADGLWQQLLLLQKKKKLPSAHAFREKIIQQNFGLFMLETAAIFKNYNHHDNLKLTSKEDLVIRFMKLLAKHCNEERSVQYYADKLYISSKHLTKTVKEVTGKTCRELIDEMVIKEAKLLLNYLGHSVANVAESLHFSDQFFFSKYFKKRTGLTPTAFRSNIKSFQ